MSATLINGTAVAKTIKAELAEQVAAMTVKPGLAVILIGARRDSATYVKMKQKACLAVGINSFGFDYPDTVAEDEIIAKVDELNADEHVHGILVQLPLPPHINEQRVLERIQVHKDVDGLHPLNVARLANTNTRASSGERSLWDFQQLDFNVSCTPQGCIELLDRSGIDIAGKTAVVIGRSNMVGIPVALLLMQRNATVTIVHSRTQNIPEIVRQADIVVAAVGRAEMVQGSWLKPGAVVIDVGINSVDDSSKAKGYRLVGDCDFESCLSAASYITPVPGGVGPMTIAMLLRNTVCSCLRANPPPPAPVPSTAALTPPVPPVTSP